MRKELTEVETARLVLLTAARALAECQHEKAPTLLASGARCPDCSARGTRVRNDWTWEQPRMVAELTAALRAVDDVLERTDGDTSGLALVCDPPAPFPSTVPIPFRVTTDGPAVVHLRDCDGNPCECGADPERFTAGVRARLAQAAGACTHPLEHCAPSGRRHGEERCLLCGWVHIAGGPWHDPATVVPLVKTTGGAIAPDERTSAALRLERARRDSAAPTKHEAEGTIRGTVRS